MTSQPWVEHFGWTLVHFLWQGVALAIPYAIARRAARTPQARYIFGCVALFAMLAAPVVTFSILSLSESVPANPYLGRVPLSSGAAAPVQVAAAVSTIAAPGRHDTVMPWVVLLWFVGAIAFWIRLTGGWLVAARMRQKLIRPASDDWQQTLDRIRTKIGVTRPVRLLTSALVQVPTVVGWLRPVVLMPIGALAGLPAEHIEMLFAHELAHIRRHDCLVNVLQSIAEALLFYHPAVWWISGHIRNEREVCCDDIAVSVSGDAFSYACALADLESRRSALLSPALAADGGSLPERIGHLLNQPARAPRPRPGTAVVAALLIAVAAWGLFAQTSPPRRVFEAVSIKPNDLGGNNSESRSSNGRLTAKMTTKVLVEMAFGLKQFQVLGGPKWFDENNYTIVATTGDGIPLTEETLEQYLQSLLTDRFHLVYHRETKELPAFGLVTAKGRPKLTPHKEEPGEKGGGYSSHSHGDAIDMTGTKMTMADFAAFIAHKMDRPVIDQTGIPGTFDMKMKWAYSDDTASRTLPTFFSALQEQVGLRIKSTKAQVEILVVDSVDKPSEN